MREQVTNVVVGIAGVSRHEPGFWNMYYRFAPQVHGRGFAVEAGQTALAAAAERAPDEPVVASLVQHNAASRRLAEKLGLQLVWEGPDRENSADTRQILADRSLPEAILERWAQ